MRQRRALASCRRVEPPARRRPHPGRCASGGFTLVELLVVLAILAGLAAIVLPQVVTMYARLRASFEQSDLEQQLYDLPQRVRVSGRAGVLADPTMPAGAALQAADDPGFFLERPRTLRLAAPQGWTVQVPKPVLYHYPGLCDGGEVVFSLPPVSLRYVLRRPLCAPQLVNAR